MSPSSTLGARIRELRRGCGLTQEELADKAGVSRDLVSKLEQGVRHSMRLSSATLLAGALGVDVRVLIESEYADSHLDAMHAEIAELRAQIEALTQVVAFAVLARPAALAERTR